MKFKNILGDARQKIDIENIQSDFVSLASHQLRTPLTAVKGYISMLIDGSYGGIPEKAKEKLIAVFQSNERLIKIINDLLNISKIELGKMIIDRRQTKIEELVESCYEEMKIAADKKKLKFTLQKPKKALPKINIDQLKVRQIILNLIDNAIRYTQNGGIKIGVNRTDSLIQIYVKDTGEGMSKGEIKNVFEGFTRGSAGINMFVEGAGLGLYVAKKFLELHQGRIWAESKGRGKGSVFFVELPLNNID